MKRAAVIVLLLGLTAGCGGGGTPAAKVTVTVTKTVTAKPKASSTQPAAPNVGSRALTLGQTREGKGVLTTVTEVNLHPTPPSYLKSEVPADVSWITVKVKRCVRAGDTSKELLDNTDFAASDEDGATYNVSGSSWDDWPPVPQYPVGDTTKTAGQCVAGWILVNGPKTGKVTKIVLMDPSDGSTLAEWRL